MRYVAFVLLAAAGSLLAPSAQAGNARSEAHQKFVQEADYKSWPVAEDALSGISVFVKQKEGHSSRNRDWYWAHFAADGTAISASADKEKFRKPEFVSWEIEGRLWVFVMTSPEAADFAKSGELAKNVTRPGAGPNRMTIRSADSETIDAWKATKGGFFVKEDEGRL